MSNACREHTDITQLFLQRTNCLESILKRSNEKNLSRTLFTDIVFFISKASKSSYVTRQEATLCMEILKPALTTMDNQIKNDALWSINNLLANQNIEFFDSMITTDLVAKVASALEPNEDYIIRLPALKLMGSILQTESNDLLD